MAHLTSKSGALAPRGTSFNSARIERVTLAAGLALLTAWTPAGGAPLRGDPCITHSVNISTGFDHVAQTVNSIGDSDSSWNVTSDPDAGTTEARPAAVIAKHAGWQPALPGSQWISSYPTAADELNGFYTFETCFCLEVGFTNPVLSFDFRADDVANVYLNGNFISNAPQSSFNNPIPVSALVTDPALFNEGVNCIRIEVENVFNVAMGLNLAGTVTASGAGLLDSLCCDSLGGIQGKKWNDLNQNGLRDAGEPALAGWTIYLDNGMSTTTDSNGNYYFLNLSPGNTYVVTEEDRPGWDQAYPLSGSHVVVLPPKTVVNSMDFGNYVDSCETDRVSLNTGYDHETANVLPIGCADGSWTVECEPVFGGTVPRPADVIAANIAWVPALPGSQWIGSSATADHGMQGDYCFKTCFCLDEGFENPVLSIAYLASDHATVYLNDNLISAAPFGTAFGAGTVTDSVTNPAYFNVGLNCIEVRIHVQQFGAVGLDLVGSITTSGMHVAGPACCDPTGSVQGSKWNDLNKDGVWNADEPAIAGWAINLSNGSTTTTDANGFYYFFDLAPGPYSITEGSQSGWTQSFPSSGSHAVHVTAGKALNQLNFGNYQGAVPYCTGNPTSSTNGADLTASGPFDAAANSVLFICTDIPANQFGLIFYGASQAAIPFGGGTLCVAAPLFRLDVHQSNAAGVLQHALDINAPPQPSGQITAGSTWNFQTWFRDPAAGGSGFNLSNGLQVTFQ